MNINSDLSDSSEVKTKQIFTDIPGTPMLKFDFLKYVQFKLQIFLWWSTLPIKYCNIPWLKNSNVFHMHLDMVSGAYKKSIICSSHKFAAGHSLK